MRAAKARGVKIATGTDPSCLKAWLRWDSEAVGSLRECSEHAADPACRSGLPFRHILLLSFTDARGGLVIESEIKMPSRSRTVDEASANALCAAAFFRYPQELEYKGIQAADGR